MEYYDKIQVSYQNVTGGGAGTSSPQNCGINHGDGEHYTLFADGNFPTSDFSVLLTPSKSNDIALVSSNLNLLQYDDVQSSDFVPECELFNKGTMLQSDFYVNLVINDNIVETIHIDELNYYDKANLFFSAVDFSNDGFYDTKIEIAHNDLNMTNNADSVSFANFYNADVENQSACFGYPATFSATGADKYAWFEGDEFPKFVYAGSEDFVTPEAVYEPKTYQVMALDNQNMNIREIKNNYIYSFFGEIIGEIHDGIAITPNYLYVTGTEATAKVNPFNFNEYTILPKNEAYFADLETGKLFGFYNSTSETFITTETSDDFVIDAIVELDENLNPTENIIMLSESITISSEYGVKSNTYIYTIIFAGKNKVVLSAATIANGSDDVYEISILTGEVTNLGIYYKSGNNTNSCWAAWGIIQEEEGEPLSLLYRDNSQFHKIDYNSLYIDNNFELEFKNDINGFSPYYFSSFIYSPWHNKLFFLNQYDDGKFYAPIVTSSGVVANLSGSTKFSFEVDVVMPANAGINSFDYVCNNQTEINLIDLLAGNSDLGGTWTDLNNTGALTNGILDATGLTEGEYQFDYLVAAVSPCPEDATSSLTLNINETPNAGVGTDAIACSNSYFNLNSTLDGTQSEVGYWVDDDNTGVLSGSMIDVSELTEGNDYNFTYVASGFGACDDDSETVIITVENCTSIDEIDNSTMTVYPNPSYGQFTVTLPNNYNQANIAIIDINGKVIFEDEFNSTNKEFDMQNLDSGLYTVKVLTQNEVFVEKLIIK